MVVMVATAMNWIVGGWWPVVVDIDNVALVRVCVCLYSL